MQKQIIGYSVKNQPIELYFKNNEKAKFSILFLGGVHGNESEGFLFLERFIQEIQNHQISIPDKISLWICPRVNPDGCNVLRRTNANNVDLNRNLPTKDWTNHFTEPKYYPGPYPASEPETKATMVMVENIKPKFIISFHSYEMPMINYNGNCLDLAKKMAEYNQLEPKGDIGYPTPGSLGTYAGLELNIPTITLEILRGQSPDEVWKQHLDAVLSSLEFYL
ncbi:MAG: murein peptide amidase A [Leptospiraceae bacterium]|nr:MAG: murein peptide amidase A [Leptospiraceae bacterium]